MENGSEKWVSYTTLYKKSKRRIFQIEFKRRDAIHLDGNETLAV